jgi:putative tricarboxylic transport membrane protein
MNPAVPECPVDNGSDDERGVPLNKDRLIGLILGAVSIAFLIMSYRLPESKFSTTVGSDVFPYLASGMLLMCSIGLVFKRGGQEEKEKPFLDMNGWTRIAKLGIVLILFPVLFHYAGFIIASLVFLFLMIRLFDLEREVSFRKKALITVTTTGVLYLLFTYLLKIQLLYGYLLDLVKG